MGTGSRVKSFPHAFPSTTGVPVLLLNQPNILEEETKFARVTSNFINGEIYNLEDITR